MVLYKTKPYTNWMSVLSPLISIIRISAFHASLAGSGPQGASGFSLLRDSLRAIFRPTTVPPR